MTMEEQIVHLDKEVKQLTIKMDVTTSKVEDTLEVLGSMNEKLKKLDVIEQGIFGDSKLEYPGILKTLTSQDTKIRDLECKIEEIEKKNREQDVEINAKRITNTKWVDWGRLAIQVLIQMVIWYLIVKGFMNPVDAIKQ